ncbi:hypothetical protein XA68_12749 [Ophiocordyceps unilateralis]|uniref:Peroxisomal biogenesis factor 11 n=1 Tax=Ophiocordyceps unilateralis TaxID=268505 RepID=A0A2A9PE96_OPHUN|nr:hypothetical protein XA68_12749 [Ophiocordyceps unilateralis]
MVADALVYHPSLAHYLRFAATTIGRDKLLRTVHRVSIPGPFLSAAALALDRQQRQQQQKQRKNHNTSSIKNDPSHFLRYVAVARQLAYAAYLSLDALALPDALGLVKSPRTPVIQRQAYRCWAAGILFSIAAQLYSLRLLRRREAGIDRKDGEGVVESKRIAFERSASQMQLLCDLCDLTIPTSALGWVAFDDGFVGLAGACSSLIGIHSQWNKTA